MRKKLFSISVFLLILSVSMVGLAETTVRKATIVEIDGKADVKTTESAKWKIAMVGMSLSQGDVIRTGDDSIVVLLLEGASGTANVELKEKSELCFTELFEDQSDDTQRTFLDLAIGRLLITSKKLQSEKSKFQVKTPTSIIGVRGTTFSVSVETERVD